MFNLKNDFNFFHIEFTTVKDGITGSLFACNPTDEMLLDIGGFKAVTLCDIDGFASLCDFDNPHKLHIGDIVTIDGVKLRIDSIDTETFEQFNAECERIEMEELLDYW